MKYILYIIFVGVLISSCSSIDCSINGRVLCHYSVQNAQGEDVSFAYPLSVTLHRTQIDSDTDYINNMSNVSNFDLPMSHIADTDEIILTLSIPQTVIIDDTTEVTQTYYISDIVKISKTNIPLFESVDCPPRYNHTITGVSSSNNFIESVIVNNQSVSKDVSSPNILIRLRDNN